jgi:hypothetical protein
MNSEENADQNAPPAQSSGTATQGSGEGQSEQRNPEPRDNAMRKKYSTESAHLAVQEARDIDLAKLTDAKGEPVSFEEWLPENISDHLMYLDLQTPFVYPGVSMTDERRTEHLDAMMPLIDEFYVNNGVSVTSMVREGVESLALRLQRLGALAGLGVLNDSELREQMSRMVAEPTQ